MANELEPQQNIAGISQIPVSVRKLRLRLIEEVSEADFILATKVEELCEAVPGIPHHAVANSLVEGHHYPERFFEVNARFKDQQRGIVGEFYSDKNTLLSYKMVDAGQVAGLLDLPDEVKNMQLVISSQALTDSVEQDEIIDMIAIRKKAEPVKQSANLEQAEALDIFIK